MTFIYKLVSRTTFSSLSQANVAVHLLAFSHPSTSSSLLPGFFHPPPPVGIGVDDAYVLIGAYKDTPRHLPVEDRIKLTLANGGVAITMTSLTDIAAFAAGTFAQVSAIQAFCLFAAVAIAVDYFLQITLFMVRQNIIPPGFQLTRGP